MIVTQCTLYTTRLRCLQPFKTASNLSDICRTIVVHLTCNNGLEGWGEAVPKPRLTGDTVSGSLEALGSLIWPRIKGMEVWNLVGLHRELDAASCGYSSAKAAVDMAFYDILSKAAGVSLAAYLGGGVGQEVATDYSIGLTSTDEMLSQAREIVASGFKSIKLKVGLNYHEDVDRVRLLREEVGSQIAIRLDANEGYDYNQAAWVLDKIAPYGVELMEQPLPRWELKQSAKLCRNSPCPIIADESVHSVHDAAAIIEHEAADGLNIKLMKCGGLYPALAIANLARANGLSLMIGGMVGETAVTASCSTALAGVLNFEYADLDSDLLLKDKFFPQAELAFQDGKRIAPGAGKGLNLGSPDLKQGEKLALPV